jgi:fatty acid desaturase
VHQLVSGVYFALVFAPNHMGMRMIDERAPHDAFLDQIETSRNIVTPKAFRFLWGALNCQIEHHLFPAMSRNLIGRFQPVVRRYCLDRGLPYRELSPMDCYREIFSYLHDIADAARPQRSATSLARR